MSHEKRKHVRTPFTCRIKIIASDNTELSVKTRDISDGGVFVVLEPEQMPPIGTLVRGQVQGLLDNAPILQMEVVRVESNGVGLKFLNEV
ncbi:MAG: PilZ domain-containing protein [Cellvibrio sp.]|nr:PilZ domain-containing protein [Cellvibrio sp.]